MKVTAACNDELVPLAVGLLEVPKELVLTALDLELAEDTIIAYAAGDTGRAGHCRTNTATGHWHTALAPINLVRCCRKSGAEVCER